MQIRSLELKNNEPDLVKICGICIFGNDSDRREIEDMLYDKLREFNHGVYFFRNYTDERVKYDAEHVMRIHRHLGVACVISTENPTDLMSIARKNCSHFFLGRGISKEQLEKFCRIHPTFKYTEIQQQYTDCIEHGYILHLSRRAWFKTTKPES